MQPGHRAYIEAAQLRAGLEAEKDPRRLITDYLSQGIETGAVSDRDTMVSALQAGGPGGAAPGGALPHGGGPRERRQVAVERSDL